MAAMPKDETIADRLIQIETVLKMKDQGDMAVFLGVSYNRYNNVRSLGYPLSRQLEEIIIKKVPWARSGWLRYGERDTLSVEALERIETALKAINEPPEPALPGRK